MTETSPEPDEELPAGTRFRIYIARFEVLSDATYQITEYLGRGNYAVKGVTTGIDTFCHRADMRKIELP